jgi:hypothetical protein
MMRGIVTFAIGASFLGAEAPLQCSRAPDPSLRREDTAGDALYELAQRFRQEGNNAGAKRTLEYLIERYPSSRHVGSARDDLRELGGTPAAADAAPKP